MNMNKWNTMVWKRKKNEKSEIIKQGQLKWKW